MEELRPLAVAQAREQLGLPKFGVQKLKSDGPEEELREGTHHKIPMVQDVIKRTISKS